MKKTSIFSLTAALMMTANLYAQSSYKVTVNPNICYQTIADFGSSDCWTADFVGKYFSDAEKEKSAKWLFSQEMDADGNPEGIGLSMWRVNLGAGSAEQGSQSGIEDITRRGYCYLDANGNYDWTKSAGQQYFMQQAKKYGVDHFLLFSNSAPVQFTKNGKACANKGVSGSNLADNHYADFAKFLTTTTKHFTDKGYNITLIDPVNEPQYDWTEGQEGSPWTNECIAKLARELDKSITDQGLSAQILLPEACQWKALYQDGTEKRANNQIEAFFNTSNSSTYIGDLKNLKRAIAGHSYWTFGTNADLKDIRQNVWNKAQEYNLDVYQTEWSMLDKEPSTSAGFPSSYDAASYMDISLYMGKLIHCDLTYGNMASVLGNYSRFIRPGYKRIDHITNKEENLNKLLGSAYLSPDGKRIVLVYVNMMASQNSVRINIEGQKAAKDINVYRTSAKENLKHIKSSFSLDKLIAIPTKSVVTIVIDFEDAINTGISHIKADKAGSNDIYSIEGKLVRKHADSTEGLAKGIYIQNGKKFVIK